MSQEMARDGTDPVTPVPLEGDGAELIGQVVDGRYRLDATLGRGGMGLVYRAQHMGLRRQVAVKILHPSLAASPEVRNRFEREALAVGKIDHPNCVAVYDVGRLPDGALYLAMELLDGTSLADVLEQEGQIAPGRALHILAHILRGLGHIHQAGLIHRDIKPENIFLVRQGEDLDFAKILDFGIAKGMSRGDLDDGVKLTQAGMAFGTPIYMAPEQALGNPMDGRADLYAAAVLAYEMLCGQPPFYSDDKLEVMSMHTARPVPPMRQRLIKGARPVPSSIEKLILRGLTKKPGDRYASAEVFLGAVEAALTTPDGGVTAVEFERVRDTGSQPLVSDDGQVHITGATDFAKEDASASIGEAIDEALSIAPRGDTYTDDPTTVMGKRLPTPPVGVRPPVLPKGGIGIGLPYTGPHGQPIFGLTQEQRLARASAAASQNDLSMASMLEPDPSRQLKAAKPKRRWPLYAAIGGGAIVIGIVIAVLTAGGGKPEELDPATPAGAANEALLHGQYKKAIQILEQNKAAIARDPQAQLVLGKAHAASNDKLAALVAFSNALTLQPDLENDADIHANLRAWAAEKSPEVIGQAFDVWVGKTSDPEAKQALLKAAVSENLERRHAAIPIILKYKFGDDVDWVATYSLDLQQELTCAKRKEAVGKLRALKDRRAVPALERAIEHRGKPGAKTKSVNWCLIEDATAAIRFLNGLK
jgi:serine/threonine protein kinase/tetratricopeptide (TPR) repeat protein